MSRGTSQDFSSKRHHHFHWTKKVGSDENDGVSSCQQPPETTKPNSKPPSSSSSSSTTPKAKKLQSITVSRLRSILSTLSHHHHRLTRHNASHQNQNQNQNRSVHLGSRVIGTLFGSRRGHVHFALQKDSTSPPAFLVELATPISGLVKEMASGLVRIALECDKDGNGNGNVSSKEIAKMPSKRLIEEPVWRTYCNGKKCGFANRRECGEKEIKILKSVEMVSMGAGVLPGDDETTKDGEIMYMRAKFERIVGSRDSEAFYMMNPDSNGAPELSIYLLRI